MIETMKTMTPEVYENKRNELIALLGEVIKDAPAIEGKTRDELDATIDRLKRNSFEIVLVGEFQGGKSTTFNAMCGREISPMGYFIDGVSQFYNIFSFDRRKKLFYQSFHHFVLYTVCGMFNVVHFIQLCFDCGSIKIIKNIF